MRCRVLTLGLLAGMLGGVRSASAQYTGNFQTNIISGVISNWTGDYVIGSNTFADALLIQNGGALSNGNSYLGYEIGADNNTAVISDSNSLWNVAGALVVGNKGSGNQLIVTNEASVVSSIGSIGVAGSNNVVLVSDSAAWTLSGNLTIGPGGPGNQLVLINGGGVIVVNLTHTATLDVQRGAFILNGGFGTVDSFTVTNGAQGVFTFNGGYLASGATQISNTQPAVIGDGASTATFQLNGGTHTFVDGLTVLSNAVVTGCGTINGDVTIYPGGIISASCGGTLTFTGTVTNNGDLQVVEGTTLETYGTFVNNGILDLFDAGPTNFHGVFINNGTVRDGANIVIAGNDVIIKYSSKVFGTFRNFQLQVTPSLTPATWTNIGPSQSVLPFVVRLLTFTDVGGATNRPSRFYRLDLN
jgi:T5SS/PEP-CTERM-associated repeat protein